MAIKAIGNGFKGIGWVVATFCPSMSPYRAMATPFGSNCVLISTESLLFPYRKSIRKKSSISGVLNESATIKMTVGTVRSIHGFSDKSRLHR